jgi:FKBP12-rapamycin complex-associated protein
MLWFRYQTRDEVNNVIKNGIANVSVDTWLQVIPQLIARIHVSNLHVRQLLHDLLISIGKAHPQGIIYSLMVASRSNNPERQSTASGILNHMRQYNATLVDQVSFSFIECSFFLLYDP